MTSGVVPCGAVEEVAEIFGVLPPPSINWFFVNLCGHGSICAAEDALVLANVPYIARPMPEMYNREIG